jgi:hypothetical protein
MERPQDRHEEDVAPEADAMVAWLLVQRAPAKPAPAHLDRGV